MHSPTPPFQDHNLSDKRWQILGGSEKIFTECGYEGASMSRIAAEANVSKGTLYNYFTNKAELFEAFVKDYIKQDVVSVVDILHSKQDNEEELEVTLKRLGLRFIHFLISPRMIVIYRIIASEAQKFPHISKILWNNTAEHGLATLKNWLDQKVANHQLHIPNTTLAAHQFFILCQTEIISKKRLNVPVDQSETHIEAIVDAAVRLFINGYKD